MPTNGKTMETMSMHARRVLVTAVISSGACQEIPRNIMIIIFTLDERSADLVEFSDEAELKSSWCTILHVHTGYVTIGIIYYCDDISLLCLSCLVIGQ